MKLDTEFIKLPLRFDAARLAEDVAALSESDWKAHPQGFAGNSALSLISVHGDPKTDAVAGPMQPTVYLERLPYVQQVLAALDAPIGRTRLMRIASKSEANAHVDSNYYWLQRVRVHVPVVTWPSVEFLCGDRTLHMPAGECWLFDTWRLHNVLNPAAMPRIHLVADTVGSDSFWKLVDEGERPFATEPHAAAAPRFVPFDPQAEVSLVTERVNFPVVMSPWEQGHLLSFLLDDLQSNRHLNRAALATLETTLRSFQREWRGLWARFGEDAAGADDYRRCLDGLKSRLKPLEGLLHLPNGTEVMACVLRAVVAPALNFELAASRARVSEPQALWAKRAERGPETSSRARESERQHSHAAAPGVPAQSSPRSAAVATELTSERPQTSPLVSDERFERPIIIVAAPRSGSTLLFETLARSPGVWTIGSESHSVFEHLPRLQPANRGFDSNRLAASDADAEVVAAVRDDFWGRLRDREGHPLPAAASGVRLLEKTPKNALRIEFLNAVFPDALFVYLFREPEENLASIIEAWQSGRFVTYRNLPGWSGPPWSLLLIPEWQQLAGKPLEEIAAAQYAKAHEHMLDSLGQLPPDRWTALSYAQLTSDPQAAIDRLCRFAGLAWDQQLGPGELPLSRYTVTPPRPDKWKVHEEAIRRVLPLVEPVADKGRRAVAQKSGVPASNGKPAAAAISHTPPAAVEPPRATSSMSTNNSPPAPPAAAADIRCVNTSSFTAILSQLGISLAVTTYQAGKLILLRMVDGKLNAHFRNFQMPMGLAASRRRLVVGSKFHVWEFRNQPEVGRKLPPAGRHDACYLPRRSHVTGDIRIHEIALAGDELWIVNTRFSCLCTLDRDHSFVPRWRPPFVTALAPEDRCHLNGLAIVDGRPKYVTCHASTDEEAGWRPNKADSGCLVDVDTGEVLLSGLSMPHSPRVYSNDVWVLESGNGALARADLASGRLETIAELPGFTRGLDFHGRYAFVGLSQVRETAVFSGIPITDRETERHCGIWVVDLQKGEVVGFLRFESGVQEIFAVQVLPGIRCPELITDDETVLANSFMLPQEALRDVPAEVVG